VEEFGPDVFHQFAEEAERTLGSGQNDDEETAVAEVARA
jgi:hypothetical protein